MWDDPRAPNVHQYASKQHRLSADDHRESSLARQTAHTGGSGKIGQNSACTCYATRWDDANETTGKFSPSRLSPTVPGLAHRPNQRAWRTHSTRDNPSKQPGRWKSGRSRNFGRQQTAVQNHIACLLSLSPSLSVRPMPLIETNTKRRSQPRRWPPQEIRVGLGG